MAYGKKDHKHAYELHAKGLSNNQIAKDMNMSRNTLALWVKEYKKCSCGYHNWDMLDSKLIEVTKRKLNQKLSNLDTPAQKYEKEVQKIEQSSDSCTIKDEKIEQLLSKKEQEERAEQVVDEITSNLANFEAKNLQIIKTFKGVLKLAINDIIELDENNDPKLRIKIHNIGDLRSVINGFAILNKEERLILGKPTEIIENQAREAEADYVNKVAGKDITEILNDIDDK